MIKEPENPLPEVILTERAAQVFKEACEAEGSSLEDTFLRIGARPGGCSGWKYELESSNRDEAGPNDVQILSKKSCFLVISMYKELILNTYLYYPFYKV